MDNEEVSPIYFFISIDSFQWIKLFEQLVELREFQWKWAYTHFVLANNFKRNYYPNVHP